MRSTAHPVSPATVRTAVAAKRAATPYVAHLDASLQSAHTDRNGTVHVTVSGDPAQVVAAVRGAGGQVLAAAAGKVSAVLPPSRLAALARSRGVDLVAPSVRAFVQDSEGVGASNAGPASTPTSWQGSGNTGSGVKVAIVDAGFANLAAEVTATHLPAGTTVNGNHCTNVNTTQHGTAVAEIVHQMAPDAQLFLYCIEDNTGFAQAETELAAAGVTVVNSSLGFPGDSRGDGTGATDSAAATVKKARLAGILWIQSAGNNALDHWSGQLADANSGGSDGIADLAGTAVQDEFDSMYLAPGVGNSGDAVLQFDGWPTSRAKISLVAYGLQCHDSVCTPSLTTKIDTNTSDTDPQTPWVKSVAQSPNPVQPPVLDISVTNTNATYPQEWDIYVFLDTPLPSLHYDLSYWGDVQRSFFAQQYPTRAATGSITEPSSSPYALAVGAACVLANAACTPKSLEAFSSQGPTIDGRTKPDITGWDSVSTYLPAFNGTFYGTSAAAPHVAGAAALVKGLHPTWDASQIQNFLEQRANSGMSLNGGLPLNPPSNQLGYGLLALGQPATSALPAGAKYQTVTPSRILDTRAGNYPAGHKGALGAGGAVTVAVPGVPADVTAVAINLTGIGANTSTFLSVYPGGTGIPRTSNLNLSRTDPTAAVFAVVTLNPSHSITVRNGSGTVNVAVDVLGYFGTGAEAGAYTPLAAAHRVLDTRTTNGGHHYKLPAGGKVLVNPAVPGTATAAIVNITVVNSAYPGGYLSAAPACSKASSTLNFTTYTRANLAVVGLSGSSFCVANDSSATDVIVDVLGYMSPTGASFVAMPSPVRIVDTRTGNGGTGNGGTPKAVGAGGPITIVGAGVGEVPHDATSLVAGVVEATTTSTGYLMAFQGATKPADVASTLNFTSGRVVPNAAIIGLSGNPPMFGVFNSYGSTNIAVDLFGYFI